MTTTILWQGKWREFDLADKESYFLGELRWEIETNIAHPLYGKELRIAGWIKGYDDFIIHLPKDSRYAYVHLTWNRETTPAFPYCKFFDSIEEVNGFLADWKSI